MADVITWADVEIDGVRHRVATARGGGRLWIHFQGLTHAIELAPARGPRAAVSTAATGVIAAPMPGKITRVATSLGDVVKAGQVLVVMEAMKMEYTLEIDLAGTVTEVNAVVGASVPLGAPLVRVGPSR